MCKLNTYVSHDYRGYYVLYQIWRDGWDVAIGRGGSRYWNERGHKSGNKHVIDTCSEESISVLPARTCAINLFSETEKTYHVQILVAYLSL